MEIPKFIERIAASYFDYSYAGLEMNKFLSTAMAVFLIIPAMIILCFVMIPFFFIGVIFRRKQVDEDRKRMDEFPNYDEM